MFPYDNINDTCRMGVTFDIKGGKGDNNATVQSLSIAGKIAEAGWYMYGRFVFARCGEVLPKVNLQPLNSL